MSQSPALSRWSLVAFAIALLVTLSELGWWTWLNLRNTARERQEHVERLAHDAQLAERIVARLAQAERYDGADGEEAERRASMALAPDFPLLTFEHGKAAARVDAAVGIERRFASHVRMFVAEGAVFALIMLLGGWLIVRAMRHELAIVRQSSNFLAAVTHELKSPLASLRLWVETLERRTPDAEGLTRALGIMHADVDRLDTLIGNVLMASKVESRGARRAATHPVQGSLDVAAAVASIIEHMAPQASRHGLSMGLDIAADDHGQLQVAIEQPAFEVIVRNLLDNAIKYSQAAGRIDVKLACHGAVALLRVTDYGIGLLPGEEKRIFDKFYRVGDEMVRQSAGTGLGLFLVRAVAQEHHGSVTARSDGLGHGCTFEVRLPLCADAVARVGA